MLELLRDLISLAGNRVELIERRLGWQPGRLARLLESEEKMAIEDLVAILPLVDLHPAEFFARLYGFEKRESPVEQAAASRLDRRFEESRRVVEEALARRATWKRERGQR